MEPGLVVSLVGDLPVLTVTGDVDLGTVPRLHGALVRLVTDHGSRRVAVDLDGVALLDDTGLGAILGAAGRAREAGGDLVVVCSEPRLCERFRLTGFDRAVRVSPSLAAAS